MSDVSSAAATWDRQSVWSQTAGRLHGEIVRSRKLVLVLTILAAISALLGVQLDTAAIAGGRWLEFTAAGFAGLIPLALQGTGQEKIATWVQARSIAETYKTLVYLSLAAGSAGDGSESGRIPPGKMTDGTSLAAQTTRLENDGESILRYTLGVRPLPRPLPDVHDLESYISVRITSQITDYYLRNAYRQQRLSDLARRTGVLLAAVTATLAALGALNMAEIGAWAAVVTTIAVAVTAHASEQRYSLLAIEYTRTAAELSRLVGERADARDHPGGTRALTDDEFLLRCENVISVQNDQWMTRWGGVGLAAAAEDGTGAGARPRVGRAGTP